MVRENPGRRRIAMLLEGEFPPDIRVENEAEALAAAGIEVTIFSLNFSGLPAREAFAPGIQVVRWTLPRKLYDKIHTTIRLLPFYRNWWLRFVGNSGEPFDALHVHDLPLAEVGWRLAAEQGVPFVLDLHENYPAALDIWEYSSKGLGRLLYPRKAWRKYELEAVSRADRVILVVEEAMERFKRAGIPEEKFEVVTNAPNLKKLNLPLQKIAKNFDPENAKLIYVGGFGPHRGIRNVIQAMAILRRKFPGLKLILVGEGSDRTALEHLARQLALEGNVLFKGWLPFDQAMNELAQADLALLPPVRSEHTETTVPHKLFQYMYFAKPIIASDCAPLKRIVEETGAGVIFRAGDARDLAEKVMWLLERPELWQKMGEKGREVVERKYNWENESKKLLRIYESV